MTINFEDLTTAAQLCTCGAVCTRSCDVCASVTWKGKQCVRQQLDNFVTQPEQPPTEVSDLTFGTVFKPGDRVPLADVLQRIPVSFDPPQFTVKDDAVPPFDVFPYSQRSDGIRELINDIDKVLPLQTWQKQALFLILRYGNMATDAYLPVEER